MNHLFPCQPHRLKIPSQGHKGSAADYSSGLLGTSEGGQVPAQGGGAEHLSPPPGMVSSWFLPAGSVQRGDGVTLRWVGPGDLDIPADAERGSDKDGGE